MLLSTSSATISFAQRHQGKRNPGNAVSRRYRLSKKLHGLLQSITTMSTTPLKVEQIRRKQQQRAAIRWLPDSFNEDDFNEAKYAKQVAKILGTNHTEFYLNSKDAMDLIPKISECFDEPFADYSQIPTFLVSKMAKSKVTVCLSGDAGDELFGGYNRYVNFPKRWNTIKNYPKFIANYTDYILNKTKKRMFKGFLGRGGGGGTK